MHCFRANTWYRTEHPRAVCVFASPVLIASSINRRVDSFASLPAGIFYCLLRKIITPQNLLCLWSKIIRKASSVHHKSLLFFSWKLDFLSCKKDGGRIGRKQDANNCEVETTFAFFISWSFISLAISWNFNFAVNLVTPFSRTKNIGFFGMQSSTILKVWAQTNKKCNLKYFLPWRDQIKTCTLNIIHLMSDPEGNS